MLPLYHILLLISSDWLGPEAGSGHFCALAEGKPAQLPVVPGIERIESCRATKRGVEAEREREVRGKKSGKRAKETEAALDTGFLYRAMPTGICIIHDPELEAQRRFRTTLSVSA